MGRPCLFTTPYLSVPLGFSLTLCASVSRVFSTGMSFLCYSEGRATPCQSVRRPETVDKAENRLPGLPILPIFTRTAARAGNFLRWLSTAGARAPSEKGDRLILSDPVTATAAACRDRQKSSLSPFSSPRPTGQALGRGRAKTTPEGVAVRRRGVRQVVAAGVPAGGRRGRPAPDGAGRGPGEALLGCSSLPTADAVAAGPRRRGPGRPGRPARGRGRRRRRRRRCRRSRSCWRWRPGPGRPRSRRG